MVHLRQLNKINRTYGVNLSDMRMSLKLRGQDLSKVHFPWKKLGNDTNHVDVAIKTISSQTEASKNFESIPKLLERFVGD